MTATEPFQLRGVVHLVRPAGPRARDLEQLRAGLAEAPDLALFYHAVQFALRHPSLAELPPDDLSAWVGGVVQDRETAERLSFAVQTRNRSAAELRPALIQVLDSVPERDRLARDAPWGGGLVFLAAESVTMPVGPPASSAEELVNALADADPSVWFFHLLEQPWFSEDGFPIVDWLEELREKRLGGWLRGFAGSHLPIEVGRRRIVHRWRRSSLGRRVADAVQAPEDARREAGREAVTRLVQRLSRPGEEA